MKFRWKELEVDEYFKRIGVKIRFYRREKGITQEGLAELCGFYPTYIGQLKRGEKNASIETLYRVSRGLNISMCSLLDEIEYSFDSQENTNLPSIAFYFTPQAGKGILYRKFWSSS